MRTRQLLIWLFLAAPFAAASAPSFTLPQVLDYPYSSELTAASHADIIAWVRNIGGVRNIWIARGPDFAPRQVTELPGRRRPGNHAAHVLPRRHAPRLCPRRRPRRQLAGRRQPRSRSGLFPRAAARGDLGGVAHGRRPGQDRRRRCAGDLRARSARLHQGRSGLDRAAGTAASRSALFFDRGKDGHSGLVARGKPPRLRLQPRRSLASSGSSAPRTQPLLYLAPSTARTSPRAGRRTARASPSHAGRATAARRSPSSHRRRTLGRSGSPSAVDGTGARRVAEPEHARGLVSRRRRRGESALGRRRSPGVPRRISTTGRISIPCRRRADSRRC